MKKHIDMSFYQKRSPREKPPYSTKILVMDCIDRLWVATLEERFDWTASPMSLIDNGPEIRDTVETIQKDEDGEPLFSGDWGECSIKWWSYIYLPTKETQL